MKMHTDEPLTLTLEKVGPGNVTAGDIAPHQDVEVMNPDQVICT